MAAGTLTTTVSLSVADGITSSQRSIIATLTQLELDAFAVASATQIAAATSLSLAQAQQIHDALASTQSALNEQASLVAMLTLNCYWNNAEQIVSCGGSSITAAYTVAAGTVVSYVSQAAADAQAIVIGTAALHCQWHNVRKTAACPDGADVVTGTNPVEVAAGTITSDVSQADADNQAQAAANAALVCQYSNAEQTQECLPDSDGVPALFISNPITVAAGTVKSSVSVANADTQALALVTAQLQCQWGNTEQTFTCPDITYETVVYSASSTVSPSYSVTIPANSYFSSFSRADANAAAAIFGAAALDCRYCNKDTPAKCAGVSSDDATADVPAGTFCGVIPAEAKSLADALASIPIKVQTSGETCKFTNDAVTRTCADLGKTDVAAGSVSSITIPAGMVVSYFSGGALSAGKDVVNAAAATLAESFLSCFWVSPVSDPVKCPVDAMDGSYPPYATPVTVPAGFFTSYTSQTEATALRDIYIVSILRCMWGNALVTGGACPDLTPTRIQTGTVAENSIVSTLDKAHATALAQLLADALNVCINTESFGGLIGAPGPAGASLDCLTPCIGFYAT